MNTSSLNMSILMPSNFTHMSIRRHYNSCSAPPQTLLFIHYHQALSPPSSGTMEDSTYPTEFWSCRSHVFKHYAVEIAYPGTEQGFVAEVVEAALAWHELVYTSTCGCGSWAAPDTVSKSSRVQVMVYSSSRFLSTWYTEKEGPSCAPSIYPGSDSSCAIDAYE